MWFFVQLCSRWQDFNRHNASRGLSAVVELLVLCCSIFCYGCMIANVVFDLVFVSGERNLNWLNEWCLSVHCWQTLTSVSQRTAAAIRTVTTRPAATSVSVIRDTFSQATTKLAKVSLHHHFYQPDGLLVSRVILLKWFLAWSVKLSSLNIARFIGQGFFIQMKHETHSKHDNSQGKVHTGKAWRPCRSSKQRLMSLNIQYEHNHWT